MRLRVFSLKRYCEIYGYDFELLKTCTYMWTCQCDCLTKERMRANGWLTNDNWFIEVDTENNVDGNKYVDMNKIRRMYCNVC